MMCHDKVDSLDKGVGIYAIIIDVPKTFKLVPQEWLIMKLVASGVDSTVVIWVREFFVGHTQRVRIGGQLSKEIILTSGVPQGRVLGPLLFRVHINYIWRKNDSSIRLFADV